MPRLQELYDEMGTLGSASKALLKKAEADGNRPLTPEEDAEWNRMDARMDSIEREIAQREKQDKRDKFMNESRGRVDLGSLNRGEPEDGTPMEFVVGTDRREKRPVKMAVEPGTPDFARCGPEYRKAFRNFVANGVPHAGLLTSSDPKGGYLMPMTMAAGLIKFLDDQVFMRQICTVLPPIPSAAGYGVLSYDTDVGDADWTTEVPASDIDEDDNIAFGKRELTPHMLAKMVKISMKALRNPTLDLESFVNQRLGYKMGVTEEKNFLTGDGNKKPLGCFIAHADGIPTTRDRTCASTTDFTADNVIDGLMDLKQPYQDNATLLASREFIRRCRKLKTGTGEYLWQRGFAEGKPPTILERPYIMSEFVPNTYTTGLYIALWGDFRVGYYIADSLGIELQRLNELFARKNQIGLIARKETDGMPVLAEAFARLKLA